MSNTNKIPKDRKIYGNCQVLSPDEILMFRCNNKKANWYLNRELAIKLSDDPLIIKLNFIPNGLGNHDNGYGLSEIENKCVNCGTTEYLTRHHVVPYCYRRFFPMDLKSHRFHDVLSLCIDCHEDYEYKAFKFKKELSEKYNVPLDGILIKDDEKLKIVKYARTIVQNELCIPNDRKEQMINKIKLYFNSEITNDDLIKIAQDDIKTICKTHGEILISMLSRDEMEDFTRMWRNHFIDNNKCKFLPNNWNINNYLKKKI